MVVDATVLAAAIFGENEQAQSQALLQGRLLAAPHLVDYEMINVALKKIRRGHIDEPTVSAALRDFSEMPIERHAVAGEPVMALARQFGLTAYDAAYLWLARELEAPLATFDAELAAAAAKLFATRA